MRFLLGQRLWAGIKKRRRKDLVANNTYILALDGDVDFKPEAVLLLVDLMRRNSKVGAACGRIHPVGKGSLYGESSSNCKPSILVYDIPNFPVEHINLDLF